MYWSRINAKRDSSRRRPLNSAIVTNESTSAIDVADARGNSLFGGLGPERCVKIERGKAPKFLLEQDLRSQQAQSQLPRPLLNAPGTTAREETSEFCFCRIGPPLLLQRVRSSP